MSDEKIKASNQFGVALQGRALGILMPPRRQLTRPEAMEFAAWIVVMAEVGEPDGEYQGPSFGRLLRAVEDS